MTTRTIDMATRHSPPTTEFQRLLEAHVLGDDFGCTWDGFNVTRHDCPCPECVRISLYGEDGYPEDEEE